MHVAIHLSHFVWHHHQYIHVVHISSPWFPVNLTPSRSYTSQSILGSFRPQVIHTPINPSSGHSDPKSFIHQSIHPQVIPTPSRSYTINPSSGHSDPKLKVVFTHIKKRCVKELTLLICKLYIFEIIKNYIY